ncbi:MAG: hypothetical protein WC956_02000 [bacterium]
MIAGAMGAWDKSFPAWARPAIDAMKRLDATDAVAGKPQHDGKFLDTDLVDLATIYARKYSSNQPSFMRILDSADGLYKYAKAKPSDGRYVATQILEHALFAGARAMIESRKANYDSLDGFAARFIDVEFAFYFNSIQKGAAALGGTGWMGFWAGVLDNCSTDLFKVNDQCQFN